MVVILDNAVNKVLRVILVYCVGEIHNIIFLSFRVSFSPGHTIALPSHCFPNM